MIEEAEPTQLKQEQLPDVCRAMDKHESKGEIKIAATTSAVDDDRTTPVTAAAIISASWSIRTARDIPTAGYPNEDVVFASLVDRGGRSTKSAACGISSFHALSQKILFRRGVKLMAAWRKQSLNSAATRERDKKRSTQSRVELFGGREHRK